MRGGNRSLSDICRRLGIPREPITEEQAEKNRNSRVSDENMLQVMVSLDRIMAHEVILMGGYCATPGLLGLRKMRRSSNDLDLVATEDGIDRVYTALRSEHRFFQTENYGDLFLEYGGIPVGFDVGKTHGWEIPDDFYDSMKTITLQDGTINTISPEYLITLKIRRGHMKGRFYGKDSLDISNLLLAPRFNPEKYPIDYHKVARLMNEHVTSDYDEILEWVSPVSNAEIHLQIKERPVFSEEYGKLLTAISEIYGHPAL